MEQKYFISFADGLFNKFIILIMKIDDMHNYLTDYYKNRRKSRKVREVQSIVKQTTKRKIIQVEQMSPLSDFQRNQRHMSFQQPIYTRNLPRGLKVHFPGPPPQPPKLQQVPYTYEIVPPRPFKMPKRKPGQIKDWVIQQSRFVDRKSLTEKRNKSLIQNYRRSDREKPNQKIINQIDKKSRFRNSIKKLVKKMKQANMDLQQVIKNKGLTRQPYNYLNSLDFFQMCRTGDPNAEFFLKTQPFLAFDVDQQQMTGLHWAAREGHVHLCRILIQKYRANCNSKDLYGRTPLHLAVENKNIECIIRIFIEGGSLHAMNKEKKSVRMVANDAYIKYLLQKLEEIKFAENVKNQIEKQTSSFQQKQKPKIQPSRGFAELSRAVDAEKEAIKRKLQIAIRSTLDESSLYF